MIRVLVVDDSAVLRQQLSFLLQRDPELAVVGQARDGQEALDMVKRIKPDVVTMDIEMPRMDGLSAIQAIMAEQPVPIVVVTSEALEGDRQVMARAKALGAVAVLPKPGSSMTEAGRAQADRLVHQVKLMSGVKVITRLRSARQSVGTSPSSRVARPTVRQATPIDVIAMGSSTGGPAALFKLLGGIEEGFGVPMLIVQHISFGFVEGLAGWLDGGTPLQVSVAVDGERLAPGHVYIAPDAFHLTIDRYRRIRLMDEPAIGNHRPSVTALFQSMARACGANGMGVILTGMGADGADGLLEMKRAGAITLAQDEASCVVYGMPKEAVARGAADRVVSLDEMATTIQSICRASHGSDLLPAAEERKAAQ